LFPHNQKTTADYLHLAQNSKYYYLKFGLAARFWNNESDRGAGGIVMITPTVDQELREVPKRPFGVYVVVFMLLLGVITAVLEIFRIQTGLEGVLASADAMLRDRSGLVPLASRLFTNPAILTVVHIVIIVAWVILIFGMWFLRRWAWLLVMIFTGVALTFALVRYFEGDPDYYGMLINVAVAFYLNDRSVQRAYARRNAGGNQ
jgi:hypothetical protein